MKYLLLFVCFLSALAAKAQDQEFIYFKLQQQFERKLNEYNCDSANGPAKAANDSMFRTTYRKIFSTVILNSADIVDNGSAFGFSQNKDATKLSMNGSFFICKRNNSMVNLGLNITDKEGKFEFYSKNNFAKEMGLKVGITIPIFKNTQLFSPAKCAALVQPRRDSIYKREVEFKEILQLNMADLLAEKRRLETLIDDNLKYRTVDKTNYIKQIAVIRSQIKQLNLLLSASDEKLEHIAEDKISEFDFANNPFDGYRSVWLNFSTNFTNNSFNIVNQSILPPTALVDELFKYDFEASGNVSMNSKNNLFFFQVSSRLNWGSFLDDYGLKDNTFSIVGFPNPSNNPDSYFYITDNKGKIIGRYDKLKREVLTMNLSFYVADLLWAKKTLGPYVNCSTNFPVRSRYSDYTNTFSALAGLIFKVGKEKDWSIATVSLSAGFENTSYNVNVWDDFLVKGTVGIPFNVFVKEKVEKK